MSIFGNIVSEVTHFMKILLSPAKMMQLDASTSSQIPIFNDEANKLRKSFASLSIKSLESFFNVSKETATLTKSYYLNNNKYQAIHLFSGIAFKTFHSFEPLTNIDDLYILSGLYGIIHALDGISPYRLDLIHPKKGSLIAYWKKKVYGVLKDEQTIISCASQEYEAILDERLPITYVKILHKNKRAPSVDAKKVRGAFAYHLLKHQSPNGFTYEGYTYIKKDGNAIYIEK